MKFTKIVKAEEYRPDSSILYNKANIIAKRLKQILAEQKIDAELTDKIEKALDSVYDLISHNIK